MNLSRLSAITIKEIRHILRDPGTLLLVLFMPLILLYQMAYAMTADIKQVPVAVIDLDQSPTSRALIRAVEAGEDLVLVGAFTDPEMAEPLLIDERARAVLILPRGFETALLTGQGVPMQVLVDGAEPQSGGFAVRRILAHAEAFAQSHLAPLLTALGLSAADLNPFDLRVRIWYNPLGRNSVSMIPGLLAMALGLPGITAAMTLAREREHGTLEQLLVTPIGRGELILGKILPHVMSGLLNVVLGMLAVRFSFGVPFRGQFFLFFGLSLLFFFAMLSLSVLVGSLMRTQAAAIALAMLVILFPGYFLTGVFFPIVSLPPEVRQEAMFLPLTHYALITRAQFLTGAGLDALWPYALALLGMGVGFTALAAVLVRKKLG